MSLSYSLTMRNVNNIKQTVNGWETIGYSLTMRNVNNTIVSPKYKKISAPLRYARRMANYPGFFSDSWLFCTCGLDIFRPRHVVL